MIIIHKPELRQGHLGMISLFSLLTMYIYNIYVYTHTYPLANPTNITNARDHQSTCLKPLVTCHYRHHADAHNISYCLWDSYARLDERNKQKWAQNGTTPFRRIGGSEFLSCFVAFVWSYRSERMCSLHLPAVVPLILADLPMQWSILQWADMEHPWVMNHSKG